MCALFSLSTPLLAQAKVSGDFDNDGFDDLAIGVPREDNGAIVDCGAVHVLYGETPSITTAGTDIFFQSTIGLTDETGDRFGWSLAAGDFNADGTMTWPSASRSRTSRSTRRERSPFSSGSSTGLVTAGMQLLTYSAGTAAAGDRYAWSLTAGDFVGSAGYDDLAVGIPFRDASGQADSGEVEWLRGSATGLVSAVALNQDSSGVSGVCEPGDRFGYSLTSGDFDEDGDDDLVVGVPYEDIGATVDAGYVTVFNGSLSTLSESVAFDDTCAATGGVEANDHFGISLAAGDFGGDGDDDLAVGKPNEDITTHGDAGELNVHYGSPGGVFPTGGNFWNQSTSGVPGGPERGDIMAWSLVSANFNGDAYQDLAIGCPGEDISPGIDQGFVIVLYGALGTLSGTGADSLTDSTCNGGLEDYDQFGYDVSAGDVNGSGSFDLFISIPFEDVGAITNAGAVNVRYAVTGTNRRNWSQDSAGVPNSAKRTTTSGSLSVTSHSALEHTVGLALRGADGMLHPFGLGEVSWDRFDARCWSWVWVRCCSPRRGCSPEVGSESRPRARSTRELLHRRPRHLPPSVLPEAPAENARIEMGATGEASPTPDSTGVELCIVDAAGAPARGSEAWFEYSWDSDPLDAFPFPVARQSAPASSIAEEGAPRVACGEDGLVRVDGIEAGRDLVLFVGGPHWTTSSRRIAPLGAGELRQLGTISVLQASRIVGRILDPEGRPLARAVAELRSRDGRVTDLEAAESQQRTLSRDDGSFEFAGLPAGTYGLRGSAVGLGRALLDPLLVENGGADVTVELRLPAGIPLHGRVLDESLAALPTARVLLAEGRASVEEVLERGTTVDAEGRFELGAPGNLGSLRLVAVAPGHAMESVELVQHDQKIELVLHPVLDVTGRVIDPSGVPVAGALVRLRPFPDEPRLTTSATDGSFAYTGVAPGDYCLEASATLPAAFPAPRRPDSVRRAPLARRTRVQITVTGADAEAPRRLVELFPETAWRDEIDRREAAAAPAARPGDGRSPSEYGTGIRWTRRAPARGRAPLCSRARRSLRRGSPSPRHHRRAGHRPLARRPERDVASASQSGGLPRRHALLRAQRRDPRADELATRASVAAASASRRSRRRAGPGDRHGLA
jgi:hypothetical protein